MTAEPLDGASILHEARALLTTYCAMPSAEAADAVVLWCAATHALPLLPFAPRLSVRSATKRAGKSRVLEIVAALAFSPLKTVNATVPAIFRSLSKDHPPTLIFDEADTIFGSKRVAENNEDLRGLLNAGFERGNPSIRCVGPTQTPTEFPSFAMCALAGIGSLPDTIEDRSIVVHMRRRKSTEQIRPFRLRRDRPAVEAVREKIGRWLAEPDMPDCLTSMTPQSNLEDRAADVWESLLMIADVAGDDWPIRARNAAKKMTAEHADEDNESTPAVQLLRDLRSAFDFIKSDFVGTDIIVGHLRRMDDAPWADMELTGHRLGRMLRDFGIKSRHSPDKSKRGYRRSDFLDAWERYPDVSDDTTAG